MEFKVGQKYKIINVNEMWDSCIYDNTEKEMEIGNFKNGDIVELQLDRIGESCMYNRVGYSQPIDTFGNLDEIFEIVLDASNEVYFAKLRDDAVIPSKIDENGGYDIYVLLDDDYVVLDPHETIMLNTGIISAFDKKYRIILAERGSTGTRGIGQRAGIIDSGYRGEWKVPFTNHNDCPLVLFKEGFEYIAHEVALESSYGKVKKYQIDKAICQALVEIVPEINIVEKSVDEIMAIKSERGTGMLGSSGK